MMFQICSPRPELQKRLSNILSLSCLGTCWTGQDRFTIACLKEKKLLLYLSPAADNAFWDCQVRLGFDEGSRIRVTYFIPNFRNDTM